MTGDKSLLREVVKKAGPRVSFGDNSKGYTLGYGKLKVDNVVIEEVSLVDGLKHNFLSISQLCDKGNDVIFEDERCLIVNKKSKEIVLYGVRRSNMYVADLSSSVDGKVTCLY